MAYQVWTKDDYEGWKRKDCEDLAAVQLEVFVAIKGGKDPLVTVEVPFEVSIKIKEGKIGEVTKGEAEPDKGAGGKGHGKVRRGDEATTTGLDKGSGDNRPDPGAGD